MRIVFIGGGSGFAGALMDHLHREGNDIYWISPKKPSNSLSFETKCTHFPFHANDPGLEHVLSSIQADAMIHLGAQDDTLTFGVDGAGGERLMGDLASLLALASRYAIGRFIFLSSEEVFGAGGPDELTEQSPPSPLTTKGEYLASAEQMLLVFAKRAERSIVVARLSSVYGPQVSMAGMPDFALAMLQLAEAGEYVYASPNLLRRPTYIADAVHGIGLLLAAESLPGGIYHIAGSQSITDQAVAQALAERWRGMTVTESTAQGQLCLSYGKMADICGYQPTHTLDDGLGRTVQWAQRGLPNPHAKPEKKAGPEKHGKRRVGMVRTLLSIAAPYFENLLLLVVATLCTYLLKDSSQFKNVDFFLIYVVLAAAVFGKLQAALSTLLAMAAHVWLESGTQGVFAVLLQSSEFVHTAVMFTLGMVVGNAHDQRKLETQMNRDEIENWEKQYNELMVINQANASIKSVLEQRLLGYGDSFAKIISIISDLDMMEPQRVVQASLDVLRRIMRTEDVAIYSIAERSSFARLSAASSQTARSMGRSIRPADFPAMNEAIEKQHTYVNRAMLEGYPLMAAPVMAGNRMVNIVMLWGMEFERLSPYSVNLLTVVSRLISSSADRAYRYNQAVRAERYLPGTDIMNEQAFYEALVLQKTGKQSGVQDFTLLEIDALTVQTYDLTTFSAVLAKFMRESDCVGLLADGSAEVLLRNTPLEDAHFVIDRYAKQGIQLRVVQDI